MYMSEEEKMMSSDTLDHLAVGVESNNVKSDIILDTIKKIVEAVIKPKKQELMRKLGLAS